MLGNHADQFMRTPMPTVVTTQERRAAQEEMPAPRPVARSHSSMLPGLGMEQGFLPGLGMEQGFLPGLGMDMGGNTKWLLLGGGALAAYFLLLRKR